MYSRGYEDFRLMMGLRSDTPMSTSPAVPLVRLLLVLSCLAASCSTGVEDSGPGWIRLAHGFRPQEHGRRSMGAALSWPRGSLGLSADETVGSVVCTLDLSPELWIAEGRGVWSSALPVPIVEPPAGAQVAVSSLRGEGGEILELSESELKRVRQSVDTDQARSQMLNLDATTRPGFALVAGRVYLILEEGQSSAGTMELRYPIYLGREEEGTWRIYYEDLVADGIPVLPGTSEQLLVDYPAGSALRFRTTATRGDEAVGGALRFVVRLDGELVFEEFREPGTTPECEEHVILLPDAARAGAELTFEVQGEIAMAAFLQPVIGPAQVGESAQRPDGAQRPDIVLCVGDTFRADNMADWGGDPALTPNLNRFAASSLRFLAARAPATATITSQAAIFSGLHPPQSGVRNGLQQLTDDALTLTEHLQASGYRTVAITDAGQVSWRYGLAQGFESFEQSWDTDFDATLESITRQLALDDGRPLFLFVHSYRSHNPYRVSAETRARLAQDYALDGLEFEDLLQPALDEAKHGIRGEPLARIDGSVERIQRMYRASVADLDLGFGRLFEQLEVVGLMQRAIVVYTSDHGEAFGAHGVLGHGSAVWDDQALVPLCLRAPGVEPGSVLTSVSLLDLAPTLSGLVGVQPHTTWVGRDLLSDEAPTPVYTFTGTPDRSLYEVAVVVGGRKLIFGATDGPGELRHAYDLDDDEDELVDLSSSEWAQSLARALADPMAEVFRPGLESQKAAISTDLRRQLEALGYAGDSTDED